MKFEHFLFVGLLLAGSSGGFAADVLAGGSKGIGAFNSTSTKEARSYDSFSVATGGAIDTSTYLGDGQRDSAFMSVNLAGAAPSTVQAAPPQIGLLAAEPETYALMLAGVGVAGFIALRRRAD